MKKDAIKMLVAIISIVLLSLMLCGCTGTGVNKDNFDVDFESDIVNLLEYNIEFTKNKGNTITQATVTGTIKNKLDRPVDVKITSEFYDKNNNYLGERVYTIEGLTEKDGIRDTTTFSIMYKGDNSNLINHAKLFVTELI